MKTEIIIYKYIIGETTPEEEYYLLDWLKTSPENKQLFLEMKAVHQALNFYTMDPQVQKGHIRRSLYKIKK